MQGEARKPGERRLQILQTLAAMLQEPQPEKITTAALAARIGVSEAALYRHFSSKAQMFEGLIEFIEQTLFGLIARITADTPSPSGIVTVERVALNPGYTYNPKINFQQGANDKILNIPPGPNGPVGTVWMALSKPTYGIHGTPDPSKIGRTQSHGCVRLTNWDATELAKMVKPGVTVEFVD